FNLSSAMRRAYPEQRETTQGSAPSRGGHPNPSARTNDPQAPLQVVVLDREVPIELRDRQHDRWLSVEVSQDELAAMALHGVCGLHDASEAGSVDEAEEGAVEDDPAMILLHHIRDRR